MSSRARRVRLRTLALVVASLCLVSCTSQARPFATADGPSSAVPPRAAGTGPCGTPVPDADNSFEATAQGGSVAGLLFGPVPSAVGDALKIVWRVTGSGDLAVTARRPDGSAAGLAFGPVPHDSGSNFSRPGNEWGTGFLFDVPGCWHIDVRRGEVSARVPIEVRPS